MSKQRYLSWLIGLALVVTVRRGPVSPGEQHIPCTGDYAPGVVLVGFDDGTSAAEQQTELEVTAALSAIDVSALRVPAGQECVALERLRRDPRVAFAELDYAVHATRTGALIPNDPGWVSQWGPAKIETPATWDVVTGTPDVVIAVVDTGVQLEHEDLAENIWTNPGEIPENGIDDDGNGKTDDVWGWRFYHQWDGTTYVPGEDNSVADDHGHGTHVAGIAGARINNGIGIAGVAGSARLMAVKVLDARGDGWYSDLAQGIVYAVDNGARIINLSLGGTPSSQTLQEAVNYAHAHGVLMVAAAGNSGGPVLYPAACDHVLAVAAIDQSDAWAGSNHGPPVDAAAPGVSIYSTGWTGECAGGYCSKTGSSMAAPHVSGLAALVWSARPDLAVAQTTAVITATALDVNSSDHPGRDEYLGWGRIDAGRALSMAVQVENLYLQASRSQVSVGETVLVTATRVSPITTTDSIVFTAGGGTVSPTITTPSEGVATTMLHAGPVAGEAVVTGTTGALTDTLTLGLLPGPPISATLTPETWQVTPDNSVALTLTACDGFGNPPLDGTSIGWTATGGTIAPINSQFLGGASEITFTAGAVSTTAMVTANVNSRPIAGISIAVISPTLRCYLPLILGPGGR